MGFILNGLDLRTIDYSHDALLKSDFCESWEKSAPIDTNNFHHLICNFKNSELNVFLDGKQYAVYKNLKQNIGNPSTLITIGASLKPGSKYYPFIGQMDELRFYNRGLTNSEIQYLYNLR